MQATSGSMSKTRVSIKETVTSIAIAFALAFVFRGFVIEAFRIPTGSMAPTLRGAHYQFKSPATGYEWAVGPEASPRTAIDPMSGLEITNPAPRADWGDRIFVMKYLYSIYDPKRWDCVVFKNPTSTHNPDESYIKRLVGLPGEEVAIVDGDIFVRTPPAGEAPVADSWALPGWRAATKPLRSQSTMWQPVFDSAYTPLPARTGGRAFRPPLLGVGSNEKWDLSSPLGRYTYSGTEPTTLAWRDDLWPVRDFNAYNSHATPTPARARFAVSDVRLSTTLRPVHAGLRVAAVVEARRHEFRVELDGASGAYALRMRSKPADATQPAGPWKDLAAGIEPRATLPAGKARTLEFWHVDQTLQLWMDGALVASGQYDWSPQLRVLYAFDAELADVERAPGILLDGGRAPSPKLRWEFAPSQAGLEITRLSVMRDIHYEAARFNTPGHSKLGQPATATHPSQPLRLGPDQFFVCGDNSPSSLDGRLWDKPAPWAAAIDPTMGVVPRELLVGKAFFVYFPSPHRRVGLPIPDAGRLRWIW